MTIAAGTRLGPYEILSPLGAGGMGEVWRARDNRLEREVAIKVLPAEVSSDPSRLRRFEKEARAASALNHPNIVTLYDIGTSDSTSWIAMERVEGKTLRDWLLPGPFASKKLLAIATQIAEGLARAHEAGIVHRDLKPENLMVTKDGLVKILDFGLAKLTTTGSDSGEGSLLPTETGTSPGMILGTVGYMSPEQAAGQPIDFRSDQFAFGSILYEMATGKRAFQKTTAVDTLSAILHDDPTPVGQIAPEIPPPLRWVVERCLSKEPGGRYGTTGDLAREIATVREHLSDVFPAVARPGASVSRRRSLLRAAGLALAAAAIAVAALLVGRETGRTPLPRFQQLTFRHGSVGLARFGPDPQTIVYSASWDGSWPDDVFTTRPGSLEARPLGIKGVILSVSPAGEMALLLLPGRTLAKANLAGGAPRELMNRVQWADWAPDGKDLAIIHRVAGKYRLELPIGRVLYETANRIDNLRLSPDGRRAAFREVSGQTIHVDGEVMILETASRNKKPSGIFSTEFGWGPGGRELWFLDKDGLQGRRPDGRKREIARFPGFFQLDDVARDGRLLLERVDVRSEVRGLASGDREERSLSWLDSSFAAALSDDGRTVLLNEGSHGVAYVRKMDGSAAVPLGEGKALALAPDGASALVLRTGPPSQLVLLPVGPGTAKVIATPGFESVSGADFLPDGKRVLFSGTERGHRPRLYVTDIDGSQPRAITAEGVEFVELVCKHVSPDGRFAFALEIGSGWRLYPLDGKPGEAPLAIAGLLDSDGPMGWTSDSRAIYVQNDSEKKPAVARLDWRSGRRELVREWMPADATGVAASTILVTPDGKGWVYSLIRRLSELYLVEGLK